MTSIYFGFTGCSCLLIYQIVFFELTFYEFSTYFSFLTVNITCQGILFMSASYVAAQVITQDSLITRDVITVCLHFSHARSIAT